MQSNIFRAGATEAVAKKSGHRIAATTFEVSSEDVARHDVILTLEIEFVKCWIVENPRVGARFSSMKRTAMAYWLIPTEPARTFLEEMIGDLARRYNAPVFEPHTTIYVSSDQANAEEVIAKALCCRGPIEAKVLGVCHTGEFTETLFVQLALNKQLQRLNKIIRDAAQNSSGYQLDPHMSFLYKKLSAVVRQELARSIKLPFSEITFDSIKAVRCASPTRNRTDVEAWRVVAAKSLAE
jgi:2'-5' RNA ligase